MMLNCLIVDDEPLARKQAEAYVSRTPFLKLIGSVRNSTMAKAILDREAVDLIFLDIKMPLMSGIEFIKEHEIFQQIIFITAFPEYAVDGFELEVTDYLMKPVTYERFLKAARKALLKVSGSDTIKQITDQPNYFYVKHNQRYEKIWMDDIIYIESMLNYVSIITRKKKYIIYSSLKQIEESLPVAGFVRIHKSFIAAIDKITLLENQQLLIGGVLLPISRSKKNAVFAAALNRGIKIKE